MDNQTPLTPPPGMPTSNQFNSPQILLPNATVVLVLGILSLVFSCCYGILGLILSIIAIVMASKDLARYNENPSVYNLNSYNNLKAGRICAIIGLILSSLVFLFFIIYVIFVGAALTTFPWR